MGAGLTPRLYKCIRCGYHYQAQHMARFRAYRGDRRDHYVCTNEARCQSNIARREADREALKR